MKVKVRAVLNGPQHSYPPSKTWVAEWLEKVPENATITGNATSLHAEWEEER